MTINQFAKYLHDTIWPQAICLLTHIFCATALISYVYSQRSKTPIIQNSPLLTISAQVMLVLSSLCLFLGKLKWMGFEDNERYDLDEQGCYGDIFDWQLIALSCLHTFFIEFMYFSYLIKMIRVLFITFRDGVVRVFVGLFKSQRRLIGFAFFMGCIVVTGDLLMKRYMFEPGSNSVHLYPQFNQFLCDVSIHHEYSTQVFLIGTIKLSFYLLVFLWSFYHSYSLHEIDNDLKLRKQYFILLMLPFSVMFTDAIIKFVDPKINTAMPVHYVDCFSNLMAGILLMWTHFDVAKEEDFSLPDGSDLKGEHIDLHYLFHKTQIRETLRGYFEFRGRIQLFNVQKQMLKFNFDISEEEKQQKCQQILKALNDKQKRQILESTITKFKKSKQKIERIVEAMIKDWKKTVSGQALMQKAQKNGQYFKKMKQLNLVASPIDNSSQHGSGLLYT